VTGTAMQREPTRDWLDADALVAAGLATSRHSVYRSTRSGDLPEPVIVAGRHLWHRPTLERFLLDRAAARAEARAAARVALRRSGGGDAS
jgi:hypothetical protein